MFHLRHWMCLVFLFTSHALYALTTLTVTLSKDHWSLRTEYSYSNYGKAIDLKLPSIYGLMDSNGNAHAILSSNSLMVSVNYWV